MHKKAKNCTYSQLIDASEKITNNSKKCMLKKPIAFDMQKPLKNFKLSGDNGWFIFSRDHVINYDKFKD